MDRKKYKVKKTVQEKKVFLSNVLFWSCIILVLAAFMYWIFMKNPDNDVWWLAATGRYIVEHHEIPTINPFSITEGYGIIVQQWVLAIVNYEILEHFGVPGLIFYASVLFYLALFITYRFCGIFTKDRHTKCFITIAAGFVLIIFACTRPYLFSYSLFICEMAVLEKHKRKQDALIQEGRWKKFDRTLLWLLPLSLIEVNCHAAMWPLLYILALPYIFFEPVGLLDIPDKNIRNMWQKFKAYIGRWWHRVWQTVIILLISVPVGLLNPNGLRGMLYLPLSWGFPDGGILELQSPPLYSFFGVIVVAFAVLITFYFITQRPLNWPHIYLAIGTALMAVYYIRNTLFIVIGAIPMIMDCFGKRMSEPREYKYSIKGYVTNIAALWVIVVLALCIVFSTVSIDVTDQITTVVDAMDYLDAMPEEERDDVVLYTEFNNGAYAEWRGYKVYIDPRPEIYEEKINGQYDLYEEFLNVYNGVDTDYDEFTERYGFTHFIASDSTEFAVYLQYSGKYEVVVDGNGYKMYQIIGWNEGA